MPVNPEDIRPSARPLFFKCPSSALRPETLIDADSYPRRLGSAVHETLYTKVTGLQPDLDTIAAQHAVDVDDLVELYDRGLSVLSELQDYLPSPEAEVELAGRYGVGGGTADVIQLFEGADRVIVLDWKSGWLLADAYHQLEAYAYLARAEFGKNKASGVAINLRHGTYEVYEFPPEQLDTLPERTAKQARDAGEVWNPGEHCGYCKLRLECKAFSNWKRESAAMLMEMAPDAATITPEDLLRVYPRISMAEKALRSLREAARSVLVSGPVEVDGVRYELQDHKREEIDARAAWGVLVGLGFTDDDMASILKVSKTNLGKRVKADAPRGLKQKREAEVMRKLRDAGAVTKNVIQKISKRKVG